MRFLIPIVLMGIWVIALSPEPAQAQILNLKLNGSLSGACVTGELDAMKSVGATDSVFSNRAGDPSTQAATVCNTDGLFTRFFCLIETTLGLVIARTFCAIRNAWLEPFAAMMMLLMAVTGMAFITGILRFTMKEITGILLKMGLVTLFVTNADVALNIAYALFLGIMKGTVTMMAQGFYNMPVSTLSTDLPYAKGGKTKMPAPPQPGQPAEGPFDQVEGDIDSIFTSIMGAGQDILPEFCSVYGLLLALVIAVPFATMFVMFALVSFFGFFARAAYGYVYALVMVTFLVAAMPIFVSFALFKITEDLFAHWYKYIGSQIIQIFLVFGIMAFASMIDFREFFNSLNRIIVNDRVTWEILGMEIAGFRSCSICDNPNFETTLGGVVPIIGTPPCFAPTDPAEPAMDYMDIIKHEVFIRFMVIHGVALYLLTRMMDNFMKLGPDIAKMLGGARLSHAIGGISTQGGNSITSPVHRGTVNFEQGMEHTDKHDDTDPEKHKRDIIGDSGLGSAWRALQGGADATTDGQIVASDEEFVSNRQAFYDRHQDLAERYEAASERSKQAEQQFDTMEELFRNGEATMQQYTEAGENFQRVQYEERKLDNEHQILSDQEAYKNERQDNARKETVAKASPRGSDMMGDFTNMEGKDDS